MVGLLVRCLIMLLKETFQGKNFVSDEVSKMLRDTISRQIQASTYVSAKDSEQKKSQKTILSKMWIEAWHTIRNRPWRTAQSRVLAFPRFLARNWNWHYSLRLGVWALQVLEFAKQNSNFAILWCCVVRCAKRILLQHRIQVCGEAIFFISRP